MTLNRRLISALSAVVPEVAPDIYTGEASTYITFHYDLIPTQFAGNVPVFYKALVQVHLFLPLGENSLSRRGEIFTALVGAGFTWPEVINASDKDGQHFVFECEAATTKGE